MTWPKDMNEALQYIFIHCKRLEVWENEQGRWHAFISTAGDLGPIPREEPRGPGAPTYEEAVKTIASLLRFVIIEKTEKLEESKGSEPTVEFTEKPTDQRPYYTELAPGKVNWEALVAGAEGVLESGKEVAEDVHVQDEEEGQEG